MNATSRRRGKEAMRQAIVQPTPADPNSDQYLYGIAHQRVRKLYGPASDYACVDCGNRAYHWSHRNGVGYSLDPNDYEPRCPSCHWFYDHGLG